MADLSKATATPWVAWGSCETAGDVSRFVVVSGASHNVARVVAHGIPDDEAIANAALIVKAVNERDELVGALRDLMAIMDAGNGDPTNDPVTVKSIRKFAKLVKAYDAAQAVLAKVDAS